MFGKNVDQNTLQALYSRMSLKQLQDMRDSLQQNLQTVEAMIASKSDTEVTGND